MEPPSAPPHKDCVSCQGLLLTVLLLTSWNLPTTAQLAVESVPSTVAEGKDVLLLVCNISGNIQAYHWYKGEQVEGSLLIAVYITDTQVNLPGPAYSGRETIYANGSLLFQNVTQRDTGYYTVEIISTNYDTDQVSGQFRVYSQKIASVLPVGAVAGIVTGVLLGVALMAAVVCFLFLTRTGRTSVQNDLREQRPPVSTPGRAPSNSSTSLASLPGPRTAVPIYEELLNPDANIYCQIDHRGDAAS
ncbi:carcinoembryonic antigen-related cell adhesion molecule 4 [Carlito syrichta]|uniref:Carcinoembryonic antigen-related cell adhesion molecule 4 n=1 Tax=Carlito syrichta TaxID=1868482 RepID=A0A1U7TB52_CARSF|nr:carcinoembryonic antigen-related cell adhesion molecule 4 [Carlito syrichta]